MDAQPARGGLSVQTQPNGYAVTKLTMRPGTTLTSATVTPAEQLRDARVLTGRSLVRGGVGADRDLDACPHLAVDLHRHLDRVLDEPRGIGDGKGLVRQRVGVTEPLPQLLGDVGRQRRDHQHQTARDLARGCAVAPDDRRQMVVQLEQPGDRGVEAHRPHVGAYGRDRAVQSPACLVVGGRVGNADRARLLVDEVAPQPLQESVHTDDVGGVPRAAPCRAGP